LAGVRCAQLRKRCSQTHRRWRKPMRYYLQHSGYPAVIGRRLGAYAEGIAVAARPFLKSGVTRHTSVIGRMDSVLIGRCPGPSIRRLVIQVSTAMTNAGSLGTGDPRIIPNIGPPRCAWHANGYYDDGSDGRAPNVIAFLYTWK